MILLLVSGKRFSGRDYSVHRLSSLLPYAKTYTFAYFAKIDFCKEHNLKPSIFLSNTNKQIKETYRKDLISFSEKERIKHQKWARLLALVISQDKPKYAIIGDFRFMSEYLYLKAYFDTIFTIRINAPISLREARGFKYDHEIDSSPSETELDEFIFDFVLNI